MNLLMRAASIVSLLALLAAPLLAFGDLGALNRQAVELYRQGKSPQAIEVAQREATLGPDHASKATSINSLAALYQAMGRYNDALPLYRRALAIKERGHADDRVLPPARRDAAHGQGPGVQDETGKAHLRHPYFWAPCVLMGTWL